MNSNLNPNPKNKDILASISYFSSRVNGTYRPGWDMANDICTMVQLVRTIRQGRAHYCKLRYSKDSIDRIHLTFHETGKLILDVAGHQAYLANFAN